MQSRNNFQRKSSNRRQQRDRILIVCEDGKNSVGYLDALCSDWRLTAAEVEVNPSDGSAPITVFKYAKKKMELSLKDEPSNSYDWVYCVFDKDDHPSYNETLLKIKKETYMEAITCVPSFEFWLLIHFEETTRPMDNRDLIKMIKKHIPKFDKDKVSYSDLYTNYLRERTDIAIKNSEIILRQVSSTDTDNPSTKMHILVERLKKESRK